MVGPATARAATTADATAAATATTARLLVATDLHTVATAAALAVGIVTTVPAAIAAAVTAAVATAATTRVGHVPTPTIGRHAQSATMCQQLGVSGLRVPVATMRPLRHHLQPQIVGALHRPHGWMGQVPTGPSHLGHAATTTAPTSAAASTEMIALALAQAVTTAGADQAAVPMATGLLSPVMVSARPLAATATTVPHTAAIARVTTARVVTARATATSPAGTAQHTVPSARPTVRDVRLTALDGLATATSLAAIVPASAGTALHTVATDQLRPATGLGKTAPTAVRRVTVEIVQASRSAKASSRRVEPAPAHPVARVVQVVQVRHAGRAATLAPAPHEARSVALPDSNLIWPHKG